MRAPLKLNRGGWPEVLTRVLPAAADPRGLSRQGAGALSAAEFSRAVSSLKFGPTFKTTQPGRHRISNGVVARRFAGRRPVILDIGASDGSTALDLIDLLGEGFERYYVTDFNISVEYAVDAAGVMFFRAAGGEPILAASNRFLAYADVAGALPGLSWAARQRLGRARALRRWTELTLVQPRLLALAAEGGRVAVERYDMMQPWRGSPPDLVKIANLLNDEYFTHEQMRAALALQCGQLAEGAALLLVDNRGDGEQVSLFRREGSAMILEDRFHGGARAAAHVPRTLGGNQG
jgi:hypothetical protein